MDRKTAAVVLKGFILSDWKEGRIGRWRKEAKALMVVGLMLCH